MKKYLYMLCSLLPLFLNAQDSVDQRLVLIGDAGELVDGLHPVVRAARQTIPFDNKTTVLFLGDNLYRYGLPDEQARNYAGVRAILDSQASIADRTSARVYFIPGNHDWENGGRYGYRAILRQQRYIAQLGGRNVHFEPRDGCPGPVEVPLGNNILLVLMDSQWWLHPFDKPGVESDCPTKTQADVLSQLEDIVVRNENKLLLFACHHPFRSNGIHGGYFGIKQHLFPFTDLKKNLYIPLPLLGSLYPITRSVFGTPQDMKHPNYYTMAHEVERILRRHPHAVTLHGHDHTLQYFEDSSFHYIVSGSGCKTERVEKSRSSRYVSDSLGFAVLEITRSRGVFLRFYTVHARTAEPHLSYAAHVLDFNREPPAPDTAVSMPEARFEDSITVAIAPRYDKASRVHRFFMGNNYRKDWATPVRMEVLKIRKEQGGMKILGIGGGKQTTSLRLQDSHGREWLLRTMDKDPATVVPEGMRSTFARDAIQDVTSAAQPYAPLVIPLLAEALRVPHAHPRIVLVPNDPALGYYRPLLANRVCLLEEREPVRRSVDTRSTLKVLEKIVEDNRQRVDQQGVLRARLLDLLIGDWDRHFDQWRFGTLDTGTGKVYFAIPRDRDQAMFNSDGLVVAIASRMSLPGLRGFKKHLRHVEGLGYNARHFDRIFLNGLSVEQWRQALDSFGRRLPDTVVEKAVRRLPPPVYAIRGSEMEEKLKQRRDDLLGGKGLRYYAFLAREVDVLGSNGKEVFLLTGQEKELRVRMYDSHGGGDTGTLLYDRVFDPKVTKEVRLYGFNDDDHFVVDSSVATPVRLRIIGGRGRDTFAIRGRLKNLLYDFSGEGNGLTERRRTELHFSDNPRVNEYNPYEYRFPEFQFPALNLGYNPEDGVMLGLGIKRRTYGFRKDPYRTYHRLSTLCSFAEQAYRVGYSGEFISLLRNNDVLLKADLHRPTVSNFFGLGNESARDVGKGMSYYRVRYRFFTAEALVRHRFFGNLAGLSAGPVFYYYDNRYASNKDRILGDPGRVGLDSQSVYSARAYMGGKLQASVYNLNSELFPTRGINWNTELLHYRGLNDASRPLTRLSSHMQVYASLSEASRLVALLRLGGGHIFSDHFEYFQALGLGQDNYLRGFRKNRFTGNSMAYGSLELRCRLLDVRSYILPGTLGVVGFGDAGRVWLRGEKSGQWHSAYGGGLYYIPYNMVILSGTVALSPEETLFNVTIGTRLNLTF